MILIFRKSQLVIYSVLLFLLSRIAIDLAWPGSKPTLAVAYYTLFGILLSLYFISKSKIGDVTTPLVIFMYPCTLLAGQMNSSVDLVDHLQFAMQVYIPCLFLASSVNAEKVIHQAALVYKKYLSIGVLISVFFSSYFSFKKESLPGQSLYDYYLNAPNHVTAQTLLKSALPLISSGTLWVISSFLLIFILNVRSTILAYLLSLLFANKNLLIKKSFIRKFLLFGAPLLAFLVIQVDWINVYDRVVFKGLSTDQADAAYIATSGRTEIYQTYIRYIINNFGVAEWLFGVGPIWLQEGGPTLSAHNDILNLLVSFGLTGLVGTLLCYLYFFKNLTSTGRVIFGISFSVLFMTNGVVFHQSNILYILLFIFSYSASKVK